MGDTFRKFISIVCVLALLTGLVPSAALAAPDGTEAARAAEPASVTADQESGEPAADRSGSFSPKTGDEENGYSRSWNILQETINKAADGATIKLAEDAIAGSSDGPLIIPDKQLKINLDGHTISRNLTDPVDNGCVIRANGTPQHTVTFTGKGTITGGRNTGEGGGIYAIGINITLEDDVNVTGNTAANGGGVYINGYSCYFDIYGSSSITENTAMGGGDGGGIFVYGSGTVNVSDGSITGNTAKDVNGGGVYVTTGGTFKLKVGSITGNGARDCLGGGVYVNGGSFIVSGSPSVTGNFDSTQSPSNVYLTKNCVISLDGPLTTGASIHVAAEQDGPITVASYKTYHDGVVSPAFFTLDGVGRFYLNTEGCLCAERSHHLPEQPEWTWAVDLTNATATMRCQSCGEELWTKTADVTFEHDQYNTTLYAVATVTHDNTTYKGRQPMTDRLVPVKEVSPSIDEYGTYRAGMREHFVINAGSKAYYFKSIQGHAGEQCKLEDLVWNWFIISATNQNTGIIQKYVDGVSYGTTQIDLPSRIENTVGQETAFVPLKILGDGVNAFYTRDDSPSASEAHVEITDRASITNVGSASFDNRSDLTLNLNTTEAITIAGNAFGYSRNVTINAPHVTEAIPIADGAFTNCENATIRTLHASGLQIGKHDDAKGRYTVEIQDGHSYNATATWAEDYSTADITITCSGCGDTHTFQATNITRTDTETVNPDTQVKTYTISITAEGSYNGQTYSVTLNPVPNYEVTVQGTEGTLRLPRARNTDNTDFADYAKFTVTQDMLDPLHPPVGAVLDGLTDGSGTYHAGDKVTITRNTDFSASWRSTWAKVQTALNDSETNPVTVTLYSDISPAAEGDSYLHIPSGKTVTLNLGNHTVNRGLSEATDNGYVIRVDGALTLSGNDGIVRGGNNTGDGGGVYVGGSFEVSGKVIIKDNKIGDTASNVYLPEGKTITVSGKLDNDARIHVSMQTPGVITSGLNAKGGDNARGKAENFVSDDENYKVIITDAGEAKLVDKNAKPEFKKARLELGGILRMRFYVELPEGWKTENDRIDFSLKDMEPLSYAYSEYQTDDEGKYFVCPVNAYQMADTITAKYYHGDEEVATYAYTVEQYLRTLMSPSTNEQTAINLATATANYGHYIQPYLAATNGWKVGEDHAEMDLYDDTHFTYDENPATDYGLSFDKETNYAAHVKKTEFYLTLDSDTLLNVRVYLHHPNAAVRGMVGDKELKQWNRGGNSVVICLDNINAKALRNSYPIECYVDGVKVFTLNASALAYVNLALGDKGASTEGKMALTALYNYAMAAKDYNP